MYLLIIRSTTSKLAIPLTVAVKDWFELAECEESTCAGDTEIAFGLVEAICGALQVATALPVAVEYRGTLQRLP